MKKNKKKLKERWEIIRIFIGFIIYIAMVGLAFIIVNVIAYAISILIPYAIAKFSGINEDIILIIGSGASVGLFTIGFIFISPTLYEYIVAIIKNEKIKRSKDPLKRQEISLLIGGFLVLLSFIFFPNNYAIFTNNRIYIPRRSIDFTPKEYTYEEVSEVKIEYVKGSRHSYLSFDLIIDNSPIDIWGGDIYRLRHSESRIREVYLKLKGKVKVTIKPDDIPDESRIELQRILQ